MAEQNSRLADKTAIVTGAAQGIGKAIALRYAEEGANLVLGDIKLAGAEATAKMAHDCGASAIALHTDVTDRTAVEAMVDTGINEFGGIDVLVNNAGIFFNAPFEQMTDDQWNRMMDVNLKSLFVVSQTVIRHWLAAASPGVVINLASISSVITFADSSAYCTAKAGVAALTRCLALEFGPHGIRANSMAPGVIETDIVPDPTAVRERAQKLPLRRTGQPEDVADLALFLASDESRYITGEMIFVDGGWMIE